MYEDYEKKANKENKIYIIIREETSWKKVAGLSSANDVRYD